MRFEGVIKSWNDERGFGFIESTQGGQEVFVHIKAFTRRGTRPQINERVSFEVEPAPQGKKRARNVESVKTVRPKASRASPARWGTATLFAIPAFLFVYLVVSVLWSPPLWVGGTYLGVSLLTFVFYAIDKSSARRSSQRIAESTLHLLSLAGGWPGALLAQQLLRHKSTKAEFRLAFWVTVVVNVTAFVVLCSPVRRLVWP